MAYLTVPGCCLIIVAVGPLLSFWPSFLDQYLGCHLASPRDYSITCFIVMSCEDNIVISCLRTSVPLTISWSSSWTCHLNICPLFTNIPYWHLLCWLLCESIMGHWRRSLFLSLSTLWPLQAVLALDTNIPPLCHFFLMDIAIKADCHKSFGLAMICLPTINFVVWGE